MEAWMRRLGALRVVLFAPCLAVLASCGARPQPASPPTISRPAPDHTAVVIVIVARGQTLDQIAKSFRVPKEAIIAANDLKPPYSLQPGSPLTVPLAAQEPEKKKPPPIPAITSQPKRSPGAPNPGGAAKPGPDVIPLD
jgi:hypothetical protein